MHPVIICALRYANLVTARNSSENTRSRENEALRDLIQACQNLQTRRAPTATTTSAAA